MASVSGLQDQSCQIYTCFPIPFTCVKAALEPQVFPSQLIIRASPAAQCTPPPPSPHCRSGQQVLPKDELCAPSSPWCSERKPPNGRLTSSKRLREATSPSGSSLLALAGSTAASGVPYLSSALHLTLFFIVCLDLKLAPWGRMWLTPLCPRAQFHLYLLSDCGIPDTLS